MRPRLSSKSNRKSRACSFAVSQNPLGSLARQIVEAERRSRLCDEQQVRRIRVRAEQVLPDGARLFLLPALEAVAGKAFAPLELRGIGGDQFSVSRDQFLLAPGFAADVEQQPAHLRRETLLAPVIEQRQRFIHARGFAQQVDPRQSRLCVEPRFRGEALDQRVQRVIGTMRFREHRQCVETVSLGGGVRARLPSMRLRRARVVSGERPFGQADLSAEARGAFADRRIEQNRLLRTAEHRQHDRRARTSVVVHALLGGQGVESGRRFRIAPAFRIGARHRTAERLDQGDATVHQSEQRRIIRGLAQARISLAGQITAIERIEQSRVEEQTRRAGLLLDRLLDAADGIRQQTFAVLHGSQHFEGARAREDLGLINAQGAQLCEQGVGLAVLQPCFALQERGEFRGRFRRLQTLRESALRSRRRRLQREREDPSNDHATLLRLRRRWKTSPR